MIVGSVVSFKLNPSNSERDQNDFGISKIIGKNVSK